MRQINSSTLIPIEQSFRISAGPGAGKTFWLIEHIKNVLHKSKRLKKSRKISCITYTNIAVEILQNGLRERSENVEISTLHSFLYKHIVKPYTGFLEPELELNAEKLNGHDDHFVSKKKITKWLEEHKNKKNLKNPYTINQLTKLPNNLHALSNWLGTISYRLENNSLEIRADRSKAFYLVKDKNDKVKRRYLSKSCLECLETDLISYKRQFWKSGTIHHDDVLYFSYLLIKQYPLILSVLRTKFPYFFVDEFQDTSPIQTWIIKQIAQEETVVGVIGDKAQSIYSFQGAKPEHFSSFGLNEITEYTMTENRRSTNQIIELLNLLRSDFKQTTFRNIKGEIPSLLIGGGISTLHKAFEICNNEEVQSLSRLNISSNIIKKHLDLSEYDQNTELMLNEIDPSNQGNGYRSRMIILFVHAIEFAQQGLFKEAIKKADKALIYIEDEFSRKRQCLSAIKLLLDCYDDYKEETLQTFHGILKTKLDLSISNLSGGKIKDFYQKHSYQQLAICTKIADDQSLSRTIHKAKGAEFDNVLLALKSSSDIQFLLNPNLESNEEHRINYVAISRAKNRLFISVPSLSKSNRKKLEGYMEIIEC